TKLRLFGMLAKVGAVDLHFLAHLMQAGTHALADAIAESLAAGSAIGGRAAAQIVNLDFVLFRLVGKVSSDDGGLVVVVAAVENVVDGVEDPLGAAHRPQFVEHQHLGVEHGTQNLHLGCLHRRVVGILYGLQQLAIVAEQAVDALLANQVLHDADREVGFADSDRSDKQQAGLVGGILLDETPGQEARVADALLALVVRIVLEVRELAMLVAGRNLRGGQQALAAVSHATLTAHRFALFAALDGLPSGAVGDGACLGRGGHEFESTAGRGDAQRERTGGPNERTGKAVWVCVNREKKNLNRGFTRISPINLNKRKSSNDSRPLRNLRLSFVPFRTASRCYGMATRCSFGTGKMS